MSYRHAKCFLTLPGLCLLACLTPAVADVKLPAVIGDNMVLQQQTSAPIWGWADPGERIRVTADWLDAAVATTANNSGDWSLRLQTPTAGGPYAVTVRAANTITLSNVLIGEVWVCSGQSNMEWSINHGIDHAEQEAAAANYPEIRLFDVPHKLAVSPQHDCEAEWLACSPETVRPFSAVGYFFGRELHRELNVPVGLIGCNWGGTAAEPWVSEPTLRKLGDFDAALDVVAEERQDPGRAQRRFDEALQHWWHELEEADPGSRGNWMSADCDHTQWDTARLPGVWSSDELKGFDGVVWYRREFDIPAAWAGQELTLELGPIDDMDTTWLNGRRVGGFEHQGVWHKPRLYKIPADVARPGRNVLAVRVLDTGGRGGFGGQPEQLRLYPSVAGSEDALSLAGQWCYRIGVNLKDLSSWPWAQLIHANTPTVLSNGMLEPLIPFGVRGVIWYQGESNRTRAKQYQTLFPALIADWRQRWGQGDFPFYYVQIAPFSYRGDTGQTAELREAQLLALATPNTGMAVTMDIGNPRDIHPGNKQEVGRRLSLWALAKTYGREELVYSGPIYRSINVEGNKIRLFFDYAHGGLRTDGRPLTHFAIAGADRQFHNATAQIDGDTVVVWSDAVPQPAAVRYAWSTANEPNLRNGAGLPASSFRTDDWPREPADAD
jgi:sialate O-acetylesterase